MLLRGKSLYPELELKNKDINNRLEKNKYDVIILFTVLACIENNNAQKKLILNIFNALKKNGMIYVCDLLLNEDTRNINRYEKYKNKYSNYGTWELKGGGIIRHHNKKWIKYLLGLFKTLEYNEIQCKTMNGNLTNIFSYFGKKHLK
jgi:2-polyprenyl-3-methyl-5-hydroxy-6-metoxy-1,4-benzoquinol methylase